MKQTLTDIECYTTYFLLGCKDYKDKTKFSFEIGERIDQRKELKLFLDTYNGFWITFNGIHYDNMVLAYGQQNNWWMHESALYACKRLKEYSDKIIHLEDGEYKEVSLQKYHKWQFTNIDLYLYWAKLLRMSKKISLKSLGIQLGYPVVQELPFPPDMILEKDQIEELKHYNLEHDLGILDLLTQAFDGKLKVSLGALGTIQLRQQVVKDYGLNAWSMDGPKIASEVLLKDYCTKTKQDINSVRNRRFDREEFKFGDLFTDLNVQFELPELKKLHLDWCNSRNEFSRTFVTGTAKHPIKVSCGVGGIHSVNSNEIYVSTNTHSIITDDIAAMYPTNIENWKAFRYPEILESYVQFKTKRITETKPGMKAHPKGSPEWTNFFQQDLFYKLILNGVSGLLDMEHSWLRSNIGIMKVRCGGQLILLTLMEKCILNDIDVISLNTDGLEVIVPNDSMHIYLNLVTQVERQFNVSFEREKYNKIVYSSVNDYVAVLENGNLKKKGMFVTDPELGNSVNFLIIPKLLEQYFIHGIPPEQAITNPKYHIYDFCASQKVDRTFIVEWNGERQQRLNRYYVKRNGSYLYKCKDKSKHHMLKGWGVQLYNKHEDKSLDQYNIDYRYYISEVRKIISTIENHNQLQLF